MIQLGQMMVFGLQEETTRPYQPVILTINYALFALAAHQRHSCFSICGNLEQRQRSDRPVRQQVTL
jgi:hypothetical protein